MDLGSLPKIPDWMMNAIFWLAMFGAGVLGIGLIVGAFWLISHLTWSP